MVEHMPCFRQTGQRINIRLVLPKNRGASPLLALREGAPERTGIILAMPGAAVAKSQPPAM
jgi:hypothetical protein